MQNVLMPGNHAVVNGNCSFNTAISNNEEVSIPENIMNLEDDTRIERYDSHVDVNDTVVTGGCAVMDTCIAIADERLHEEGIVLDSTVAYIDGDELINDNIAVNHVNIETVENNAKDHVSADNYEPCPRKLHNSGICTPGTNETVIINNTSRLEIMVWNIQGLGDKLKDSDFLWYLSVYDLIIFLETMKLDRYTPDTGEFVYKHFQRKYQHPRARKPAGGIGVLIRSSLVSKGTVKIVKNSDFTVWIRIKQNDTDLFLGGVYIPQLDSSSTVSSFQNNNAFNIVQEEISYFSQQGSVAICGDFNARTGQLPDYIQTPGNDDFDMISISSIDNLPMYNRHSDDPKSNKYGKELIELCKSCSMRIMNGYFQNDMSTGAFTCYTPRGKSLIDYLICDTSFYHSLLSFDLEPLCTNSDHRPLVFSVKLSGGVSNPPLMQSPLQAKTGIRYYKYVYDPSALPSLIESLTSGSGPELQDAFIDSIINDGGVNEAADNVYTLLETAISGNCPKKFQKALKNSFPCNKWFDDECKILKRLANDYAKNHDLDIEENLAQYLSLKKSYKATIQRKKREYQNSVRTELNNLECKNPVDYWKYWDKLKKSNKVTTVGTVSLSNFEEYFKNMQVPPRDSASTFDLEFLESVEQQIDELVNDSVGYMTDHPITVFEVQTELKTLKQGKAPGVDGISNEFYKHLSEYLVDPLTTLFNYVWLKGDYPDKWCEGVIQPLHKKGSYNEPDNYRKLTLMACMGKIFESIVNKRLVFQTEASDEIDPNQFGFTRGCRTSDNVFIIDTLISYQKSMRKNLFITFIDFSKAFDFVNRSFLYYKMIRKGYGGRLVKIIRSMFSKSHARVRWQGELGASIDSTYGVLQGGIVSPKLFNLYLSDMGEYLDETCGVFVNGTTFTHLLYADDLVLVSETENGMQTLLNNVEAYCRKWHLIINSQKSKVMMFHKTQNKNPHSINFSIDNKELEMVSSYKYLGHVLCNSRNIHKDMYAHLVTQAQKATYALKENTRSTVGYLPPKLSLKMFDTHILPILEYNSEIWFSEKENSDLERIQLNFLKNMLSVRCQTSTTAILTDTGRFPLLIRQHSSALKYLDRLRSLDCPVLLHKCLEIQLKLREKGSPCWLSRLSKISDSLDIDLMNCDVKRAIVSLFDQAKDKMMFDINDSTKYPKLRTYKTFKTEMRLEPYLNFGLPKSIYTSIARFRLSSHNLSIELGRHKRPYVPPEDRICEKCNLNLVEDEFHCLMMCTKWTDLRVKLFEVACRTIDGFLVLKHSGQFHEILTSKNIDLNFALGKFLHTALKIETQP